MGQDLLAGFLGTWSAELNLGSVLLRVLLSMLLSAIVGCERSSKRHSAGLRTFMLVSLVGTGTMLVDQYILHRLGGSLPLLSAAACDMHVHVNVSRRGDNQRELYSVQLQEPDQGTDHVGRPLVLRRSRHGVGRRAVCSRARAVPGAPGVYVRLPGSGKAPQEPLEPF